MSIKTINAANEGRVGGELSPTDLDLMLYVDGELDEERCVEIRAYIERDADARAKVAALRLASDIVYESAFEGADKADDIASLVMEQISREPPTPGQVTPGGRGGGEHERDKARNGKPANDNARGIFALTALAVAAAAGLMIWGRTVPTPMPVAHHEPAVVDSTAVAPSPQPSVNEPKPEGDDEPGVEIAAVDFGARVGTIFYVSDGAAASHATTAVVWLNDDDAGGDK